jgi:glycerophosphoryl diester phosphodiesterase
MKPLTTVAHRGASAVAPENTLAAFRRALALGADVIETDVRPSKDGELVLFHDDDLRRIARRPERIEELDGRDLASVVVGADSVSGPQTIPRLRDLLRLAKGRVPILLDLKLALGGEPDLVHEIRLARAEADVILGIHSVDDAETFRRLAPQIARLSFAYPLERIWDTVEVGVDIVRLWSMWVDVDTIARAKRTDKPIWVMCGKPNEREGGRATTAELISYRRLGADGVILNDPRVATNANATST